MAEVCHSALLRWAVLVLVLVGSWCLPAQAATVKGLYDTAVAVTGQDPVERRRAFRLALESVLVKLTGDGAVAATAELAPIMSNAQVYVSRYSYKPIEGKQAQSTGTGSGPTHILDVSFAADSLNRALNNLGLPLWGAERPETLLWLAVQDKSSRYILAGGNENSIRKSLNKIARKRALPILLPLMDLQDQSAVDFSDVRGGFTRRVEDASRRHGVSAILTGSVSRQSNGWNGSWVLYRDQRIHRWKASGGSVDDVLTVGMEGLANQLALSFSIAVNSSESSTVRVRIDQIDSLDDYARVVAYLDGLAVVEKVSVDQVSPAVSYFQLNTLGSDDDLRNAIALNSVLREAELSRLDPAAGVQLHYEFMP